MKKSLALAAAGLLTLAGAASAAVETYSSTDTPKPIPVSGTSGDMAPSIISVAGDDSCGGRAKIFDVNVGVEYTHTWNGDLTVRLTSPDFGSGTTTMELWSNLGGSSDNMDVVIDDQAENGPINNRVIDGSSWQAESGAILCAVNGENAAGDWQLDINDNAGGDLGTLQNWYLEVDCQTKGKAPGCEGDDRRGRGLGSWANNGRGNGDDLPPRGQRGR